MKAVVDKDLCIGCGLCESTCPEVFSIGDDGKSQAISEDIPKEFEDNAVEASTNCPVGAITIE
ncbi:ferredoxin [Clostridium tarantellae]|uniref:Ferredoxin n=1 Tax=Clostridium tarantellae TaxID=39493 RepID=A0A6I1MR11_9CLOT|nr:ferredoxin [Clostridium tarantellae]MPQ44898.1 4Fe-4S dicluster domain-containing protein [Clostridium tarantellae]